MKKYVALFRGINVGGNCKVSMSDLKKHFQDLGFENVLTYINSGNVIFESKKILKPKDVLEVEKFLEKKFGFNIKILVRSKKDFLDLNKKIPKNYTNDAEQRTDVLFLWEKYDNKKSLSLIKINEEVDNLKYIDGAIIWNLLRKNYTKSKMNKFIGSEVYRHMTARNINTVRKLAELL